MTWQAVSVIVAVLAGVVAFFIVRAMGLEVAWPQWVTPLAVVLVVLGGMMAARKRK